jgi:iron(III) transport system ATP-binding protein
MSGLDLRCEAIRKAFGGRVVLEGVEVAVEPGKVLVLLGASGSGKTTLLRIVAGLEPAGAGRVLVGGRALSDPGVLVPPEGRGVGMVFQDLELWPHMTVAEHLAFGLPGRPRGRRALSDPRVVALAERVGIEAHLGRRPATLSGGERQRVAIARTLGPDPAVVLYDEPLANLDPERRAGLRRLVRDLTRSHGSAVLYVTHDAEDALELGDEVAVLSRGRIVDRGAPDDLYRRPKTLAGARALGPVNAVRGAWREGRLATPLGVLTATAETPRDATLVLLRPEDLVPSESGVAASVEDARPRGARWAFTASVGDVRVEGRSDRALAPGATVRLAVRGPVTAVPDPPPKEDAA